MIHIDIALIYIQHQASIKIPSSSSEYFSRSNPKRFLLLIQRIQFPSTALITLEPDFWFKAFRRRLVSVARTWSKLFVRKCGGDEKSIYADIERNLVKRYCYLWYLLSVEPP
ncbi:hypothetical protein TNIN_6231 [Trichonephila inaurata madagascariensis]|uniref:Uncharacterized protein n=1 Tax=Trichonephila inaurata madagascariensis TaxID=2747483 RepID=A0A8X6Y7U9_9ARAC|nr:hypothetical protein TNIN_6231 [Trichonephila inaurata madagascariensis]